jgi:hypothetical protein
MNRIEDKNYKHIGHGIHLYKNFLNDKEVQYLCHQVNALSEKDWFTHPTESSFDGKVSINLDLFFIHQKIIDSVIPYYWINQHFTVNRLRSGEEGVVFGNPSWNSADYIVAIYFGEWVGGELKILNHPDFKIKANPGDLLLLPINENKYQAEKVLLGTRYVYIDYMYKHMEWVMP